MDILPFEENLSRIFGYQVKNRFARSRLSTAAFSHESHSFTLRDIEANSVHRVNVPDLLLDQNPALVDREVLHQVSDLEEGVRHQGDLLKSSSFQR